MIETDFLYLISGTGHNFSPILKMTEMISVDSDQCELIHRGSDRPTFNLHHSFNCFEGDGSGTCSGDGGSPLVCPIPNSDRYMQVSVFSLATCSTYKNVLKINKLYNWKIDLDR